MGFDISRIKNFISGGDGNGEVERTQQPSLEGREPRGEPTIVVVDDEQAVADMYYEWLEGEYDVKKAYDGEEALEKIDQDTDLVLLDRRMPGMSGDEVL
ncbi:MAG: response regulator, partial [Halobacteria archaeon]|nr:response regulator [Halobacteria archaeon]